ncbi:MAG: hypothetical protein RR951_01860 [Ruthenibacterium sp.]
MQRKKKTFEGIFTFVTALAICTLIVLDGWALLQGPAEKPVVNSVEPEQTVQTDSAPEKAPLPESTASVADGTGIAAPSTQEGAVLAMGKYKHELGAYGFSQDVLVPNIIFNADGSFVFSENTGSGMGTCTGTYTMSKDGTTIGCTVTGADIACPDVISFTLVDDKAIMLNVTIKKSLAGDSFVLEGK